MVWMSFTFRSTWMFGSEFGEIVDFAIDYDPAIFS